MKAFLLLFILVSCGPRGPLTFEYRDGKIQEETAFNNMKIAILDSKCLSCHKNFSDEENLFPYLKETVATETKLFKVLENGSMPKKAPPLTTKELEEVKAYIEGLPRPVSFEELNDKVLVPKCISCHKKIKAEENLERWINQDAIFTSKLYTTTLEGSMPKKAERLSEEEMKLIVGYLRAVKKKPVKPESSSL